VLDYDDMLPPLVGHPSVAMIPALVALAQQTGADGARFSAAYIAGYELLAAISPAMALKHVMKGWHSTASMGVLGATAACSVLLGLDEEQAANAIGLAVTQAAGNRQNFGTMAKSFQIGQCNAAAVRAALLAQKGFTAPHDAIEGKYGFLALYGENEDMADALAGLGRTPLAFDTIGIDVKKYPCCYAIHKALDGVLALRRAHGLTWDNVGQIEIVTQTRGLQPLTYTDPQSGLEGKFSMEYAIVAAMLDGRIQLSSFDDAQVARSQVRSRLTRVTKREAPSPMLPRWATVRIVLQNGSAAEQHVTTSRGDAQDPLTDAELVEKAEDCFAYGGRDASARELASKVFELDQRRIRDVIPVGTAA
jgi:2-methylcitrate dehydratase PrpD